VNDPRTPEQIAADESALKAFEEGRFLTADSEPAVNRARLRSPRYAFDADQEWTGTTAIYPGRGKGSPEALTYCALKLCGESGELAEKLGKLVRGGGFQALANIDDETQRALSKELGDVLWYLARLSDELELPLSEVAALNVSKLTSRKVRGVIHGSGDDR